MANVEVIKSEKANKPNYVWCIVLVIGAIIVGVSAGLASADDISNEKISGCYYITNHLYEGRGTSLCITSTKVTFTLNNSSVTLYPEYIGDNLYIKNEYDDTLFRCTASKEDNNSIQCKSFNQALGTGSNVWKKD